MYRLVRKRFRRRALTKLSDQMCSSVVLLHISLSLTHNYYVIKRDRDISHCNPWISFRNYTPLMVLTLTALPYCYTAMKRWITVVGQTFRLARSSVNLLCNYVQVHCQINKNIIENKNDNCSWEAMRILRKISSEVKIF